MPVVKRRIREEFLTLGLWDEFVALRERLVAEMPREQAWEQAAVEVRRLHKLPVEEVPHEDAVSQPDTCNGAPVEEGSPPPGLPAVEAAEPATLGQVIEDSRRMRAAFPVDRFQGKTCSPRVAVEWVAANIAVEGVRPEDCPGPEAWGLLFWARHGNQGTFWTNHYTKLMPSKSEVDGGAKRYDDGRDLDRLIGVAISAAQHATTAGIAN
jgi:hypothetical protein